MSDTSQYRPVRGPLPHPVPLNALADVWAALDAPPIVDIPDPGHLANIARANLPIMIGRVLIRAGKMGGKWHVSRDDLKNAAWALTMLAKAAAQPESASGQGAITIRGSDPEWPGKLARMLHDTSQESPVWNGPTWKKAWYWSCQWGCLDFSQIAEALTDAAPEPEHEHESAEAWTVAPHYADFLAAGAALVEEAMIERRRCSRCGALVARRVGWADLDTPVGWENLCVTCLATHDSNLRDYSGQLRDIPYARARYRRENPPTWYRCVVCGLPAVVWDHCHEHGYIRGPLCRGCNANDRWLFRSPYRFDRRPIDHVEQCKGCAGTRPGPGIGAAIIQYWIATEAVAPDGHDHPQKVEYSAFPSKLSIQEAIRQQTYAVEPLAWTCRECEEHWEQSIDPDQLLVVSLQIPAYLHTGDLTLITADVKLAASEPTG